MAALFVRSCLSKQLVAVRSCIFGVRHLSQVTGEGNGGPANTDNESHEEEHREASWEDYTQEEGSEYSEEDQLKGEILTTALQYVPQYGWSTDAIATAAKDLGLSPVSEGMFPRGGGDLVLYFVEGCNLDLSDWLQQQSRADKPEDEPRPAPETIIRDALEYRLRMHTPYMKEWPQAMGLMIQPQNALDAVNQVKFMVDEIWYHAGDTSTDVNWYVKRGILAGVYGSTELYMVQDHSEDFKKTWAFLDRRLWEIQTCIKSREVLEKVGSDTANLVSAAFTTARNMGGFNKRNR